MATHSSVLAWITHGQRSPAGYSPWGHKKLEMTEVTWHTRKNEVAGPRWKQCSAVGVFGGESTSDAVQNITA